MIASPSYPAENTRSIGVSTYLVKPIESETLIQVIQQLTGAMARRNSYILVVDDDVDMATLISATLQEHDYVVEVAHDGSIALEMVKKNPLPSLILLDLMMPIVHGFQLLTRLRADPLTSTIPVIIVTARDLSNDEITLLRSAAQGI